MPGRDFTHDEIVEYASLLYGDNWRNKLAEDLKVTRKQLVLTLAAGDPVPASITVPFLSLIEDYLHRQAETVQKIESRLHEIRGKNSAPKQPPLAHGSA